MKLSEIIEKSLPIFNVYGYQGTDLELLLEKLQIRPSDFNRDFTDFDDLIVKTFYQLCSESDEVSKHLDKESTSLEKLYVTTLNSYEVQLKYRFIFLNLASILDRHEKIKDRYFELISLRKAQMIHNFVLLHQEGIFKPEPIPGCFENLSNQMIMLSDFWPAHNHIIFGDGAYHYQYYSKLIFSMVLPYLTNEGLTLYKKIFGYGKKTD
ncbi:MAG: TetR/AcrR family transcriptional regulator [Cyclobacteriaceae bacterium]